MFKELVNAFQDFICTEFLFRAWRYQLSGLGFALELFIFADILVLHKVVIEYFFLDFFFGIQGAHYFLKPYACIGLVGVDGIWLESFQHIRFVPAHKQGPVLKSSFEFIKMTSYVADHIGFVYIGRCEVDCFFKDTEHITAQGLAGIVTVGQFCIGKHRFHIVIHYFSAPVYFSRLVVEIAFEFGIA